VAEDGTPQVTAWLAGQGSTPVFGTTLGHSTETLKDPVFHQLLANAVLYVTGNQGIDGKPKPGSEPIADSMDVLDNFSAPKGIKFLGQQGLSCARRNLVIAAAPCYLVCILNPLEWGEATKACKQQCDADLPKPDVIIAECMPTE